MNKMFVGVACCLLGLFATLSASAQLPTEMQGKAVGKAAQKMAQAANQSAGTQQQKTEKQSSLPAVSNPEENTYREGRVNVTDGGTYVGLGDVMGALPALPTAKELQAYKEAQLMGGRLQLVTSPVAKFLSDKKALVDLANRFCPAGTETEQATEEVAQYLTPVESLIAQWDAVDKKIAAMYESLTAQQKEIYGHYAEQLATATGGPRNSVLAQYYAEFVDAQRNVVQQALQLRLNEQMPLAENIEKQLSGLRAEHPALPNYPQMTKTAYFAETDRLLAVPEF